MRILLTANASYVPPRGGATRSNLAWLERLAAAAAVPIQRERWGTAKRPPSER
jgi:hypothetical protein